MPSFIHVPELTEKPTDWAHVWALGLALQQDCLVWLMLEGACCNSRVYFWRGKAGDRVGHFRPFIWVHRDAFLGYLLSTEIYTHAFASIHPPHLLPGSLPSLDFCVQLINLWLGILKSLSCLFWYSIRLFRWVYFFFKPLPDLMNPTALPRWRSC